jgi:MSHA biogenesis protein MshM
MYYSHFGLNQAPFKITPNTEFFFGGGNRGPVLEALIYAISHGEGIIKVTGEVGSGKTMLCHMLQTRLPPHIITVYIPNPSVSPDEILRTIAFELQLDVAAEAPRLIIMQMLHDFLLKRYAEGKRVVVFVEESQGMPLATLEEIRLLSNLETRNDKLLQIVLFGQPELDESLGRPNIRQLRERITQSFQLEPLDPAAIREYLMFRMRTAGYRGPDLFSRAVVKAIASASEGLTRRVNLIADKALLAAFSENTHTLRTKHVEAAVRDSEFSRQAPVRLMPRFWWAAGLLAAGATLGIAVYALLQHGTEPSVGATSAQAVAAGRPAAMQQTTTGASANPASPSVNAPSQHPSTPGPQASDRIPAIPEPAVKAARAAAPSPASDRAKSSQEPLTAESGSAAGLPITQVSSKSPLTNTPGMDNTLETRLAATQQWLASESETTFSIQLMGAEDATQLKQHLNVLSKSIEMNKIFVYRTVAKEKPSLTVLYGSFSDQRTAQQALKELPLSVRAYKPLLRTVQGIRGEISRYETVAQPMGANS